MKFFVDTANLKEIEEAQSLGILDGVTTNPSLMAKEGITILFIIIYLFSKKRYQKIKLKMPNFLGVEVPFM